MWNLDVDSYNEKNIKALLKSYSEIEAILTEILSDSKEVKHPSVTLITKIMLGVFGNIPAFDRYFTTTFHSMYGGFLSCQRHELDCILDFYTNNKAVIDSLSKEMYVIDFNGMATSRTYKKVKLIDMYGFTKAATLQ